MDIKSLSFLMFISVSLTIGEIKNGYILEDAPNTQPQINDEDLSVHLEIDDDDYEMISEQQINLTIAGYESTNKKKTNQKSNTMTTKDKDKALSHCSNIAKVKVENPSLKISVTEIANSTTEDVIATVTSIPPIQSEFKLQSAATDDESFLNETKETLEEMKHYDSAVKSEKYESGYTFLDSIRAILSLDIDNKCTAEDSNGIGFRSIYCLIKDFNENRDVALRLSKIALIWFILYLVVAIPLWCSKGWFCCCLCCKFFKPHETIQEAKKYLLLNPPGTMVTKKGDILHYEPTERETDCYEEFGHFIRTL